MLFNQGSLSPFIGVGAHVALQFGSNEMVKKFLMRFNEEEGGLPTIELIFISGLLTGIPSTLAVV
jgi:hypothetical protein